jgi:predicted nucleic-acid-binding Zn-ribbon protein
MKECLQCKSQNVASGKIYSAGRFEPVFKPDNMKFWTLTTLGGTTFLDEAFACLDCGLIWSSTCPDELRGFIRVHCKNEKPPA